MMLAWCGLFFNQVAEALVGSPLRGCGDIVGWQYYHENVNSTALPWRRENLWLELPTRWRKTFTRLTAHRVAAPANSHTPLS